MRRITLLAGISAIAFAITVAPVRADEDDHPTALRAPAGNLPTSRHVAVDGFDAAVLPNGRIVTPLGSEVAVGAPKPFGMAVSPDGRTIATVNSGEGPFSVTLIKADPSGKSPSVTVIPVNASFLGVMFSPDGERFYASGGENGNIWIGDVASAKIIGTVNLNGKTHPTGGISAANGPATGFKGAFPGHLAISRNGRSLYVTDQGSFSVFWIDTVAIKTGLNPDGGLTEPDNFAAVVGSVKVGRYPFGLGLSADSQTAYVTNVGLFQYSSLAPAHPTGDPNVDFPLCYPGTAYPDQSADDRTVRITKVNPRHLPASLRDPAGGIRCGYIAADRTLTVPGLGSPNAPDSSSVYTVDVSNPRQMVVAARVGAGPRVGDVVDQIATYGGSHPNAVVAGRAYVYVANGNDDTISVLSLDGKKELRRISLAVLEGYERRVKGAQPVALALTSDQKVLYVAEAGLNAIAVVYLEGDGGRLAGMIPTGWWPAAVALANDGHTLFVANANGRGAGPNNTSPPDNLGSSGSSTIGTVNVMSVPSPSELRELTARVMRNNGLIATAASEAANPIPAKPGRASQQIKHVIFINKENATFDLLLGDIDKTRRGVKVNGEPSYALPAGAAPNHHEIALQFAFSDNFYLEPSVSSDGHRWLTDTYTTEFEQTHWPASYGGKRNDAGDDQEIAQKYPGRLGFTDANGSPDPNDYNLHGSIFEHLARHKQRFVVFGNGFEFAEVDEGGGQEPTGIRNHVNVPMEGVVRANADHLFPEYNTHIPDAPLPEDISRFNRFDRFKQVFRSQYVDHSGTVCKMPSYVDLYYPNDHTGGAHDINPNGPAWSAVRYFQDNDSALGLTLDLISHSPCWKDTVIFAVEDDAQNGNDHVDGSRSLFLAAGPWVKRQFLARGHYSLSSIFKTVNLILGIPPLNQYDAAATDLREIFTMVPNYKPYNYVPLNFATVNAARWSELTTGVDFSRPDTDNAALQRAIQISEGIAGTMPGSKPGKEKDHK